MDVLSLLIFNPDLPSYFDMIPSFRSFNPAARRSGAEGHTWQQHFFLNYRFPF
uniref:Uncharacterized protein n=1 Tax=Lepeophtheirus salmonis TaxID=72036 RepID=A0A0K2U7K4_LEPSM